jgi:hypothetical protein
MSRYFNERYNEAMGDNNYVGSPKAESEEFRRSVTATEKSKKTVTEKTLLKKQLET